MPEREGLIARVRQIRRASGDSDLHSTTDDFGQSHSDAAAIRALENRIDRLEKMVEELRGADRRAAPSRLARKRGA